MRARAALSMSPAALIIALLALLSATRASTDGPETFAIAAAPQTVAVGSLSAYQPGVCFSYANLQPAKYFIQVWLLDSYHWWCASEQFCPYKLNIDNSNGDASSGITCVVISAQVTMQSHVGYQWVSNLVRSEPLTEAGVDSRFSGGAFNATPPVLQPIADQAVAYPDSLSFKVQATSANPNARLIYSLTGAPAGAAIAADGTFTWVPTASLTTQVMVTVADAANSYVSDSKVFRLTSTGVPTTAPTAAPETSAPPAPTPTPAASDSATTTGTNVPVPAIVTAGRAATPTPKAAVSTVSGTTGAATVAATTTGAAATSAVTASTSFSAATTGATIASTIAASTTAAATTTTGGTSTTGGGGGAQFPPVVDNKFSTSVLVGGLNLPTDYGFLPDGSMLITEKAGRVRLFKDDYLQPDPWLDISGEVSSFGDRGLLSIAIDPDFSTNAYVYLGYTVNPGSAGVPYTAAQVTFNRIIRYTHANGKADPASRFIVLGKDAADSGYMSVCGSSHAFGSLRFANDKSLMFSTGDGANFEFTDVGNQTECDIVLAPGLNQGAFKAQSFDTLNGKIGRIDRFTGLGLPDNPFYDANKPIQSRIWALGLRNPFRFDVKPDTPPGTILLLGCDVGWATYEEVNVVQAGANLGWPCWEGMGAQPEYGAMRPTTCINPLRGQLTRAIIAWNHQNASMSSLPGVIGNAAAGVATYAGSNYPASWQGGFWFGDYQTGWVKVGFIDLSWELRAVVDFGQANSPITFGRHPFLNGDIIYICYYAGEIRHIQYGSSNPIVVAKVEPPAGPPGTLFQFVSDGSHEPLGRPVTFAWDFGDGETSALPNPTHSYATAGIFLAKLTLTSSEGTTTKTVRVNTASFTPIVGIVTPVQGQCTYTNPQDVLFYADTSDSAGPVTVLWDVQLVHNGHFHPYEVATKPDNPATFTLAEAPDAQNAERYSYRVVAHAVNAQQIEAVSMVSCTAVGATNRAPVAAFTATPETAASPYATILFDSLTSTDPDGDILWVDWDFGDGLQALNAEQQVYHTYSTAGAYTVTLSIRDNYGGASTATKTITIS